MIPVGVVASSGIFVSGGVGVPNAPVLTGSYSGGDGEGSSFFYLSWTVPANNGSPITNYRLEISLNNLTWSTYFTGSSAYTSDTVAVGFPETYYYRVLAINAIGSSVPSNVFAATA